MLEKDLMAYELSNDANADIQDFVRYTTEKWGDDAVDTYVSELLTKLDALGKGAITKEKCFDLIPDLYVTRYRHYLIY